MSVGAPIPTENATIAGVRFAGIRCGIKPAGMDLALAVFDEPCSAAGCFTKNEARAASVVRNASLLPTSSVHAIIVNSGNANAMTGAQGDADNRAMAAAAASELGLEPEHVLTASTGTIGVPLPLDLVEYGLHNLVAALAEGAETFAKAILTTDTATKIVRTQVKLSENTAPVAILGVAKGSGMVHPNMATTLGFVFTDAIVSPAALARLLSEHVDDTFNAISVDGDTSTNDALLAFATGASAEGIEAPHRYSAFSLALGEVLLDLAKQVAGDGEGATRRIDVEVSGAPNKSIARAIARGVCRSNSVKCSAFAGEAEFGRVALAVGQVASELGVALNLEGLTISAGPTTLYDAQGPCARRRKSPEPSDLDDPLDDPVVRWSIDLGLGSALATAYGCDLTYDFVRLNAAATPQTEASRAGGVAQSTSLTAYSPGLKHQLLCEGLSYVRRFTGLRTLVFVQRAEALAERVADLARDLELCLDAGLRPLAVLPDTATADAIMSLLRATGHDPSLVSPDPTAIGRDLDRGKLAVLVRETPAPDELIDLALRLGIGKLIALGCARGLRDTHGFVRRLSPDAFLAGHARGRFDASDPDLLVLAKHAATRGIPALHIIDARVPHAVVGELFTDDGVGTLITRQT